MKLIESFTQFAGKVGNWVKAQGLSTIILIFTLIILILTFQYAYRPYVGVTKVEAAYDGDRKDLTANIIIKNTGNIPANNVQTS